MQTIQIQNFTPEDLRQIISEEVKKALPKQEKIPTRPRYYSRHDVANIHDVSLVTVDKWSNAGHLKKYKIGGKIRFKANEVEMALEQVKNLKYKR